MIVDVLRNDLGRVCRPGQRPRAAPLPPRADRGRPAPRLDRDRAAGAGPRRVRPARGLVPGRLDHRRAEDPGDGAPRGARAGPARAVHRGARLDRAGRRDGDLDPDPDVRRRRRAAEPPRRRRDHVPERPGGRVGRDRRQGARAARGDRRHARSRPGDGLAGRVTSGSTGGSCRPTRRTCPRSIAASSSATACSRRSGRAPAGRPSCRSTSPGCGARRPGSRSRLPDDVESRLAAGIDGAARGRGPRRAGRRREHPDHRLARRLLRPGPAAARRAPGADDRHPGLARAADPGGPPRARPPPRREHASGATPRTRSRR